MVTAALLALPADVLAASLGINVTSVSLLSQQVPSNKFVGGVADCEAACAASSTSTTSTAMAGRK